MGWLLTSFMPKISEEGNEVETLTARLGVREGEVGSSDEGCEEKGRVRCVTD